MKCLLTNTRFLLLLYLTIFITTTFAQNPNFEWAISFGSSTTDVGRSISVDDSGNVYTAGYFNGTVDFDPGAGTANLTSVGSNDVFIQKLDASGNFLWAKTFGGSSGDFGFSIVVDASGSVYIAGRFEGIVDFDPGAGTTNLTSAGQQDAFIQKLDASGNFLWARSFGGGLAEQVLSIALDSLGNIYTTGTFGGIVDFDPGAGTTNLISTGNWDVFIQKLDTSGNFLWAKSFGGTSFDYGYSIAIDNSGNVYTIGNFLGTVDFDPGAGISNLTSAGQQDGFIQKLDASGNFLWANSIGGSLTDFGNSITLSSLGSIYTTGTYRGTVDFDPGAGTANLTSAGGSAIFVQKLDSSGNYLWAKSFGGSSTSEGLSIKIDNSENVYTTGYFVGIGDFDPGIGIDSLTSAGSRDVFIHKMDSSGNYLWARSFGGSADERGYSLALDSSANVYTTGQFQGTVDFDPGAGIANLTSVGSDDVFVHKMSQCTPNAGTDVLSVCDSLIWIDSNTYTANNNTATFTLTNAAGCDSVVTLNLIINTVSDITTVVNGFTITASNSNATYKWLDCNNGFNPISGETNQSFTATANGSYAVELTENGCVDTSQCVVITTVGIKENSFEDEISIYPNPTKGDFSIDLAKTYRAIRIQITDVTGKLIRSEVYKESQILNLQIEEAAGMYLLTIEAEGQRTVIQLRKE